MIPPSPACSFCLLPLREVSLQPGKLIAGPVGIYICTDCVRLCADILVEGKADGTPTTIGDNVDHIAKLTAERDAAVGRARQFEIEMTAIASAVTRVMPTMRALQCAWCEVALDGETAAREHVAICEQHPAVIALRRAHQRGSRRRRPPGAR